jgi:putative colanic acid biosynthesis acetyltransferase WcaF
MTILGQNEHREMQSPTAFRRSVSPPLGGTEVREFMSPRPKEFAVGPSFSLKNRLARLLWSTVYLCLFRPSPRPLHAWRAFLLRCFGARLGQHCHVYPCAKIWAPWNLTMDDYACLADDVQCYSMAPIFLGKKAVVSQGSFLCTGSHDYESPDFQVFARPIRVEAQAWVCAESFVLPGITIGEGAVVGARSVVTRDLPPWMICAGNPCRPLKPRPFKHFPAPPDPR